MKTQVGNVSIESVRLGFPLVCGSFAFKLDIDS